jgi:SRSO17 transposase
LIGERLKTHLADYQYVFRNKTKIFYDKAVQYTSGIVLSELKNIERICEDTGVDYHQMQHFITESNWDERKLINHVSVEVSKVLPKRKLTGLIIDESGWEKKGDKSVGVGWQYCGNAGKVCNSQVGVFACLSNGDFATLIDARLYLPVDWCNNPDRCEEAGIPQESRVFKTKLEIAIDIIGQQVKNGVGFDFVGADGYYGNDANFARKIDDLGYLYMLDIHCDQTIYIERPELAVPGRTSTKGPSPSRLKATTESISVGEYHKTLRATDWEKINVRNTSKGKLKGHYHFAKVFIWNRSSNLIEPRLLVIRKTKSGNKTIEIKYSFTNANLVQYTTKGIAYMQAQRFFVEHSLKESKQVLGLDQFQTRKWRAWHHQVALNFLISSFILKEKLLCFDDLPLLSARDIKEMLVFQLYKQMTNDQMIDRLFIRHMKRQAGINYSYSKNLIC